MRAPTSAAAHPPLLEPPAPTPALPFHASGLPCRRAKLEAELAPLKLDIVDNSYQHAGHSGEPLPPEDSCPRLAPAAAPAAP